MIKIYFIDFEFLEFADTDTKDMLGTFIYFPPELVLFGKKTMAGDVWSMGCIIYTIFTDDYIIKYDKKISEKENYHNLYEFFRLNNMLYYKKKLLFYIKKQLLKFNWFYTQNMYSQNRIVNEIEDLISKMLILNYKKRITTNDILNHSGYFVLKNII